MELQKQIKKLRTEKGMTQEDVATYLNVAPQTVSKWERGLVLPDVYILPRIAMLFGTSTDALLGMSEYWSEDHHQQFITKIRAMTDCALVVESFFDEIQMRPTCYDLYIDLAIFLLRHKLFDDKNVTRMIELTEQLERFCTDDDIRNEMHRKMVQICAYADEAFSEKALEYYQKIPSIHDSREIYASLILKGNEKRSQIKKNILTAVDFAECAVRQLIDDKMSPEEKLHYYEKALSLYEWLLEGEYGGFYEYQILSNQAQIIRLLINVGKMREADEKMTAFFQRIERMMAHFGRASKTAMFVEDPEPKGITSWLILCKKLLKAMEEKESFSPWKIQIHAWGEKMNDLTQNVKRRSEE